MTQVTGYKSNLILDHDPEMKYGLSDVYKYFKKKSKMQMDYKKFKSIALLLGDAIFSYVLKGNFFQFPYKLGILRIAKRKMQLVDKDGKPKRLKVDFYNTKRLGKTVYHLNEHWGGCYGLYVWRCGHIMDGKRYSFKPIRDHKRAITQAIKNGQDYLP